MALTETEWYVNPREVCEFAYWLHARGYFEGARDVIRYFENPQAWASYGNEWLRDRYEAREVPAL